MNILKFIKIFFIILSISLGFLFIYINTLINIFICLLIICFVGIYIFCKLKSMEFKNKYILCILNKNYLEVFQKFIIIKFLFIYIYI